MANSDWILEDLLAQEAWIRALARRLVTDPHAAEDVVQDAWVEALARPPDKPDRARTWFRRVVQNLAFKRSRSLKRQREREKQAARPYRLPSVAEMQERASVRIEVTRTVFSLDEPYRSAILFRYFENLPPREIAERLGVSPAAVEGRLRRGLQKLRARLDRDFGDRRNWCAALLPLIGRAPGGAATAASSTPASILTGALIMSTKTKMAVAVAAMIATAVALWYVAGNRNRPEVEHKTVLSEEQDKEQKSTDEAVVQTKQTSNTSKPDPAALERRSRPERDPAVPADQSITGTVKDPHGAPLVNAIVRALQAFPHRTIEMKPLLTTRVDARGRFVLGPIRLSQVVVEASADGFHTERKRARPRAHLNFVLGPPSTLTGRVLLARAFTPISANVAAYRSKPVYDHNRGMTFIDEQRTWAPDAVARTDENGRYRFQELKPGRYLVKVLPVKYPSLDTWFISPATPGGRYGIKVRVTPGQETVRDFVIQPGTRVHGRVLDRATGRPVAGAKVGVRQYGRYVLSGEDGRYEIRFGRYASVHVTAVGYLDHDRQYQFTCPEVNLDFRLAPGPVIKGRVLGPDGAGIPDAHVARLKSRILSEAEESDAVLTDERGDFVMRDLRRGRILARRAGFAWGVSRRLEPATGQTLEGVVIHLGRGGTVLGSVRYADGRSGAGAEVNLQDCLPHGRWWTRMTVLADADGSFRIDHVPSGKWRIQAMPNPSPKDLASHATPAQEEVMVSEGSPSQVNLLLRPGLSIAGRAVDDLDRPVKGAAVSAIPWRKKAGGRTLIYLGHPPRTTVTDATGSFRLTGLPGGEHVYSVEASKDGHRLVRADTRKHAVPAGISDLLFRATRLAEVRGRVADVRTRKPVTQFTVNAEPLRTETRRRFPIKKDFNSPDGRFVLPVQPGEFRVKAITPDGRESEVRTVQVLPGGNAGELILEVAEQAGLTGHVRTPFGQPAYEGEVRAISRDRSSSLTVRAQVDARGSFRFPSLSRGTYRLVARHPRHPDWHASTRLQLEPGVRSQTLLNFVEGGVLAVLVTDEKGQPVHGASVDVLDANRDRLEPDASRYEREFAEAVRTRKIGPTRFFARFTLTSEAGQIRPWKLPPGRYSIQVRAAGFDPANTPVLVTGAQETKVTIQLKAKQ